jgi:predicted glycogen debranching enzyme
MLTITIAGSSPPPHREAIELEWLETNGMGGYASSTILNCHTRKYHGLLVANLKAPPGRYVLLSKFEDSLSSGTEEVPLSSHQYPGVFFPPGEYCLKEFHAHPCPRFVYRKKGFSVTKSIMLIREEDTVLTRYEIGECGAAAVLRLRPFLAYREHHALSRQNDSLHVKTYDIKNGFMIQPYDGMPALFLQTNLKSRFFPAPVWYKNFEYQAEEERGYEWHEDLFQPGLMEIPVKKGSVVIVQASLNIARSQLKKKWHTEESERSGERQELEKLVPRFEKEEDRGNLLNLLRAGRQFLIRTPSGRPAIIAGYHWFGDWGRDTLISLPALTFSSGRPRLGITILNSLAEYERDGLLPNCFAADEKDNGYNSVDTPLWYFWAVQQMLRCTGDAESLKIRIWPVMKNIIRSFLAGTIFNIRTDGNGLLTAGSGGTQLTWMDASIQGKPVTPRWGYAVEINALWYNAVCFAAELAGRFDDGEPALSNLAGKIRGAFNDTFRIGGKSYLGDVFHDGTLDEAVRPNQILAVSLPYSPLDPDLWQGVVDVVRNDLLTPFGLRTLSPADPRYEGHYGGDGISRDMAYHQGTAWPWLLSHFGEALLKTARDKKEARQFLLDYVRSFVRVHLPMAGVGCVSEIFDGDPPHQPNGCIAQAWSTAALISLYSLISQRAADGVKAGKE